MATQTKLSSRTPTGEPERAEAYRLMRVLGYQHQPTVIHVNDDFDVLLPTLKVPVHTSFGIAEVKQIQAVNPKFGVDNVILTPESVTQLTDEEASQILRDIRLPRMLVGQYRWKAGTSPSPHPST